MPKTGKITSVPLSGKWIITNEEDGSVLWALANWTSAFLRHFPIYSGTDPLFHVMEFEGEHFTFYTPNKLTEGISRALFRKVMKDPKSYLKLTKEVVRETDKLYVIGKKAERINARKLTDKQIVKMFEDFTYVFGLHVGCAMTSTLVDIPHSLFTNFFKNFLKKRVWKLKLHRSAQQYFSILSAIPDANIMNKERKGLYQILKKIQASPKLTKLFSRNLNDVKKGLKKKTVLLEQINGHAKKYAWAYYGYVGPVLKPEAIIKELRSLIKEKKSADIELKRITRAKKIVPLDIKEAEEELELTAYEKDLFQALRETVFQKLYRKDAEVYSFYAMGKILREVARRAKISFREAEYLVPGEISKILEGDKQLKANLKKRTKYVLYLANTLNPKILTGPKARACVKKFYKPPKIGKMTEFSWDPACLGKAKGTVKKILTATDMPKMKKDDILVSVATTPEIVPAMKKAAAIVTEQGGITSHAAIISRELNTPCVIGTNIATKVLKNGDKVEVDANEGIIKILK